jgi:hypothetical protein
VSRALTPRQLSYYVDLEVTALAEERFVAAVGTAAAISEVLVGKKALRSFRRMLEPGAGPAAGDSPGMAELRRRIHSQVLARDDGEREAG